MTKQIKKLLLYLVVSDPNIIFGVQPKPNKITSSNELKVLEFDIDINCRNKIKIDLYSKKDPTHYIQIKEIILNNTLLTDFDLYSVYKTAKGKIKKTNGWLDEEGSCIINIRSNSVIQNMFTYLLLDKS